MSKVVGCDASETAIQDDSTVLLQPPLRKVTNEIIATQRQFSKETGSECSYLCDDCDDVRLAHATNELCLVLVVNLQPRLIVVFDGGKSSADSLKE